MEQTRPNVGIGVIVLKEGKILLGERLSGHGAGNWQLPGGHLELGDTFEDAARKEVAEETGLSDVAITALVSVHNEREYGRHYVNLGFLAEWRSGEPYAAEPEKSGNWGWVDPENLPQDMFAASRKVIDNWRAGTLYSD